MSTMLTLSRFFSDNRQLTNALAVSMEVRVTMLLSMAFLRICTACSAGFLPIWDVDTQDQGAEVAKAADFRAGLKDGYRIDWVGEERAKVIADRRFLMFRSLVVRTLGVVREDSSWKIVW